MLFCIILLEVRFILTFWRSFPESFSLQSFNNVSALLELDLLICSFLSFLLVFRSFSVVWASRFSDIMMVSRGCRSVSEARQRDTITSLLWRLIIWKMAGDHTSASSDSSIKFDVGVLSAGITITARARSDVSVMNASRCWMIWLSCRKELWLLDRIHDITAKWSEWLREIEIYFSGEGGCVFWTAGLFSKHDGCMLVRGRWTAGFCGRPRG